MQALALQGDYLTDLTGSGLLLSGTALTLDRTGDWTGTLDSLDGAYYLANSFSTSSALYFANNRLTLNELADVATTSVALGDLLYWNGTSWTDIATSTLAMSSSDIIEGTKLFFTYARATSAAATYINASSAIPSIEGSAIGELLYWNGAYWATTSTSLNRAC